ncbi:MAG TPA: efflux RND transporter periplasmic adaptor subunit [Patescibacteria group bacterium]|nr:efflux RND transporter periplasmic adaptor subunit [Patescibacteria group bacterium]
MFFAKLSRYCVVTALPLLLVITAGCGGARQAPPTAAPEVKAVQVIQKDLPLTSVYSGQVQAKNEVKLQAKVSGNVIAKMISGGDIVQQGQPLFQIDRRQYETAVRSARALVSQSESALSNSQADVLRYRKLATVDGIAQQILDTQIAKESQDASTVDDNRAKLQQAENDLQDTLVLSPLDGRIDVNDVSVGTYVTGASTVMATISSVDPVFVQFSMSENEYLSLAQAGKGDLSNGWGNSLKLVLSNGTVYPLTGKIEQVDRGLAQNTGTLTIKALFDNPQRLLLPGMFTRVEVTSEIRQGALLVPQRAVQRVLEKTFVTVATPEDKAELREVKLGTVVGNLWLVEEGLNPSDRVIVEGAANLRPGTQLTVIMVNPDDLKSAVSR